jgi:hypothetical protein
VIARATSACGLASVAVLVIAGCGSKPPPRACSTEAPPAEPKSGPLEIGMCPMDPLPDAGPTDASPSEVTPDATNGSG